MHFFFIVRPKHMAESCILYIYVEGKGVMGNKILPLFRFYTRQAKNLFSEHSTLVREKTYFKYLILYVHIYIYNIQEHEYKYTSCLHILLKYISFRRLPSIYFFYYIIKYYFFNPFFSMGIRPVMITYQMK